MHKPLLQSIRRAVREKKALEFFARLRVDVPPYTLVKLPVTLGTIDPAYEILDGSRRFVVEGHALHLYYPKPTRQ